jgi:riboflavin synthase
MFTGIIVEIGLIQRSENVSGKRYFNISCNDVQSDLKIGDSIACDGICLTVVGFSSSHIRVEVMNQTYLTTTASKWQTNTQIHLEPAMMLGSRLHGHIVQGHVDITTSLIDRYTENKTIYLEFRLAYEHSHLVVEHGSVCIDGASLTIAKLSNSSFTVALIEHTLKNTHFEQLKIGGTVNIEFDIIGKYVQRLCKKSVQKEVNLSEEWLSENGFL